MLKSNYLIINKKAQSFKEMRIAGRAAVFIDEEGRVLDYGVLSLGDPVYTLLSCEEVRLLMLVREIRGEQRVEGIFWKEAADYEAGIEAIRAAAQKRISKQDLKISSYAWSIAEKLADGVRVRVTDALDASDMAVCPDCGMLNPKGSQYCLDCGAEL